MSITAAARAPDHDYFNLKVQNLRCKSLFFNSLAASRLKVHVIVCHLKKLLFTVASIDVFTLNGVSPIQLVAIIAFSAGVYAARFRTQPVSLVERAYQGKAWVALNIPPFAKGPGRMDRRSDAGRQIAKPISATYGPDFKG